jgi:hypothetical protein
MRRRGFYWCVRHERVESGDDLCPAKHRLGPFPTASEAARALQRVRERNEAWDAEDRRWHGEAD